MRLKYKSDNYRGRDHLTKRDGPLFEKIFLLDMGAELWSPVSHLYSNSYPLCPKTDLAQVRYLNAVCENDDAVTNICDKV